MSPTNRARFSPARADANPGRDRSLPHGARQPRGPKVFRHPHGATRHAAGLAPHQQQRQTPCRLHVISIDPNYYSPHEAAAANHFSTGKAHSRIRAARLGVSADAPAAAAESHHRLARQSAHGRVFSQARLSPAPHRRRASVRGICLHAPGHRKQGRSRPAAQRRIGDGICLQHPRRRPRCRLPAPRFSGHVSAGSARRM